MFSHSKKDYYSVNSAIAVEANQQQRIYEATMQNVFPAPSQQMMGDDEDGGAGDEYPPQHDYNQRVDADEFQRTYFAIQEQMGAQATRYDDVYHPRTDKRQIGKLTP